MSIEALIEKKTEEWVGKLTNRETDKEKAEDAINSWYEACEKEKPKHIVWVDNPLDGAIAAYMLTDDDLKPQLENMFRMFMEPLINIAVDCREIDESNWDENYRQSREIPFMVSCNRRIQIVLMQRIAEWLSTAVEERKNDPNRCDEYEKYAREFVLPHLPDDMELREGWEKPATAAEVMCRLSIARQGIGDCMWIFPSDVMQEFLGEKFPEKYRKINDTIINLCTNCGWIWPYEDFVIATPLPQISIEGREFHADGGSAISFGERYKNFMLNGVEVPEWLATTPDTELDPKMFSKIDNAEVRREFVAKVGMERIIKECGADVLDSKVVTIDGQDHLYELINFDIGDGRKRPFLKMMNASLEGMFHVEGVPPEVTTVDAALEFRNGTIVIPEKLT